jgi:anaerobic selenocysteine-containing dehydrogenase
MSDELIRTNGPRDCYDGCGILVRRRAGQILNVRGDPEHPISRGTLCPKCTVGYNGVWQDERARLLTPLRRSGPKGSGAFEAVSWETAIDEIAGRLGQLVDESGPESILHTHYSGTLSMLAYMFPMRFFHRLGASEVEPDTICNMAGHVAWGLLFGSSARGFDPRTATDAACLLIWGANPAHSAPHMHEHWLDEFPGEVVVVDPLRTDTAKKAALHLQPRPGSDAALAFSMLHVLDAEGCFDENFLRTHTRGAEELRPALAACTPDWGEQQTGVPAEQIVAAARCYGAGPALLWAGQALQRQPTGGNVMRAVGLLPAVTGNVGKPGAGFYYLNSTPQIAGARLGWLIGAALAPRPISKLSHMDLAAQLEAGAYRALLVWNTNPVASAPEQQRLRAALARETLFSVDDDCFPTDTADLADFVLPAAGFLEFDDLTFSYMNLLIGAQTKVREPLGEALPNMEIFRRLARAMGFEDPELFASDRSLIDTLLEQMDTGLTFEELVERGSVYLSDDAMILHRDLRFDTPSGKIEIASDAAEAMGLPRLPQPWVDAPPRAGRMRLLTPASKWRLNDSFANDPKIAALAGAPAVVLHPEDAERLSIQTGDRVRLANATGEIELHAEVDTLATPGVLVSYKGRWPNREPGGVNVNVLHPARRADMGESTAVHAIEVEVCDPHPKDPA